MMMKYVLTIYFLFIAFFAFSQVERDTDVGLSFTMEVQKEFIKNLSWSLEEEVRLQNNEKGFDRSVSSLGMDYSFWDKRIKIGGYYAFLYLYNEDRLFEARHRYYLNLIVKESINRFTLSWRGRIQGTHRNENRGEYKTNPKYVMKNKFEIEYSVWGKPWKPFISCDLSSDLNNPSGNELTRIRSQIGTNWRLNRTDYIDFFLRYDHYLSIKETGVLLLGVAYKIKL
ncbi:DUF2490 domain-containing protein [Parabacteroides sp. PF5-9]|uniref:DUF2490 domain-containing protein n=1 Tax=Parabacteroides sp. PF5-9 TaxID=1742404 RepID=UPI0024738BCF|nr:DUF2490 domain-containing protein [Parabacteroides sp. PF5-9]MDH6356516.1 hypothetical protein [Parabacteroides sp. PF5-9]